MRRTKHPSPTLRLRRRMGHPPRGAYVEREGRSRAGVAAGVMAVWLVPMALVCGCRNAEVAPSPVTVDQAWQASQTADAVSDREVAASFAPSGSEESPEDVIAYVNGEAIERSRVVEFLLDSHGVRLLEQLVVLEAARQLAAERGLEVSAAEVETEYARSLETLVGDAVAADAGELRRQAGETLLDQMLSRKNSSRSEYMVVIERNAILRRLAVEDSEINEEQLRGEYRRLHGERVEIRHIQTSSPTDFERLLTERANGAEFGDLALRYSANRASAERLGLLPPFTEDDASVPEAIRREAFLLPVGHDSNPIFVDGWYHLIRVNRRIEASGASFDAVREEVERSLRERLTEAAMRDLHAELFHAAKVEILDSRLRELFHERHPNHGAAEE